MSNTQAKRAKHKQRLQEKMAKRRQRPSYTYEGGKFRTSKLLPLTLQLESWLCKVDAVIGEHRGVVLEDRTIELVFRRLIDRLHEADEIPVAEYSRDLDLEIEADPSDPGVLESTLEASIAKLIAHECHGLQITAKEVVGVLRTLNGSLATWTEMQPDGRGYIDFIQEQIGARIDFGSEGEIVVQESSDSP